MVTDASLRVVLDIDGLLADFEGKFCFYFGSKNRQYADLEKRYPYKRQEIRWFVNNPKTYIDLAVIPLGWQVYYELLARDFEIWCVTSRPKETAGITQFWLDEKFFYRGTLMMAGKEKLDIIASLKPLFIVDDIAEVAQEAIKMDIPALLITQPWNETSSVPRFSNIEEFDRELEVILDTRQK